MAASTNSASGAPTSATTRQIASAAGVHQSTVSLALRNHPRIPQATRARIQAVAARLGYRHDPRISELMEHLRRKRGARTQEALAYVADAHIADTIWRARGTFDKQHEGAKAQAARLGYRLDDFWVGRNRLTAARLTGILRARGIRGILVGPVRDASIFDGVDWDKFASVALNYTPSSLRLHCVTSNHMQTLSAALALLVAKGFTRIGFIHSAAQEQRIRHIWTAAYHGFLAHNPQLVPLPVCTADSEGLDRKNETRAMLAWYRAHRPQVVITTATEWLPVLRHAGFRCPENFSFLWLDRHQYSGFERCAGIDQRHLSIGAHAINQLAGCLMRSENGLPDEPIVSMIEGCFVDGATLSDGAYPRPRASRSSSSQPR